MSKKRRESYSCVGCGGRTYRKTKVCGRCLEDVKRVTVCLKAEGLSLDGTVR